MTERKLHVEEGKKQERQARDLDAGGDVRGGGETCGETADTSVEEIRKKEVIRDLQ